MSRKLIAALIGLAALILGCIAAPVLAASNRIAVSEHGVYHALFLPAIVWIAFIFFAGLIAIEVLLWLYQHHKWPFDGSFFK